MYGKYKLAIGVIAAGGLFASPLYAQFFDTGVQARSATAQEQQYAPAGRQYVPSAVPQEASAGQQAAQAQQQALQQQAAGQPAGRGSQATPFDYGTRQFTDQAATAGTDNRPKITFSSNKKKEDQELIMMYMKDFKIYRSPSGQTRCSVQFAIVTTLPVKLSNISYRLQWPKMDTVLSFSNVEPQVENHFNYSLLGDGCYSMDRSPNIVINRCRVKGMSQRACAAKVRWITRAS